MSQALPKGFLWGNSTSSMQTEGGYNEGGRGPSVYDPREQTEEHGDWKVAIDEYHRYEEDYDLMQQMGMNCYRFQIGWSRVCPTGDGDFNQEGIDFYRGQIKALIARGITPMICLYHFDMPLALAKKYNGFLSRHVVDAFVRFGKRMIDEFADLVPYWIVFNEQNLYTTPYAHVYAGCLEGGTDDQSILTITNHVMSSHAQIANYLHEKSTTAQIGGMLAYEECYAATSNPRDAQFAREIDEFFNKNLLDVYTKGHYSKQVLTFIKNHDIDWDFTDEDRAAFAQLKTDFIAFSYYRSDLIDSSKVPVNTNPLHYLDYGMVKNPYTRSNEWGWNVDPLGFRDILTKVYNQYDLPMFPIENGIGIRETYTGKEIQDDYRIDYHREHIQAMKDAIYEDGVEVLGYLGWGLIDIPASSGNMDKRYGAVYVNRTNTDLRDLARIPKKSFGWFKQVFESNGANLS
ncbi:glycoside hydrolase family 1 protein [Lacticaseibacillus parakribbianus]|uniref:glycoside hydrolase family 1 protein n=1 Tax=Lacticaseibacillus parakribbianus TaxID=2970927 RepID=UPI0021CB7E14|nr:glycoside hydrolase family 1 protein [Lacticaseibacillus parakribbianus]